ncbi:MAG: glutamate-1-semialdehyde 2,1-aminomutase [Methanospirillum sp.]|uniref:glutamate-1-semialdehyde 2,1-aminomutase n=1 Tax=Methanospirillum sp. TaxID=45200 RepID=UPI002373AF2E|nr:glutamate-1-semialdehyde 2,1-aminomutase [Methanospirillum sp.]MDD1730110.1 glutamate-1-semialdehyde 2,1-aminomutase [Methanospirillum sp.]
MKSSEYYNIAKEIIPGGVSSPVRAIQPYPFYVTAGHGSRLHTADGTDLVDCCGAYGPMILGHSHPAIREAITKQLADGWLYGTPTPAEITLAKQVTRDHPSMNMIRFVSSGSEATMAALRLARGFTGRPDIIKIEGGFHGAHDAVLVQAGSGCTTLGQPDSAGIPTDLVKHTRQIPYNDIESLTTLLDRDASSIAALIMEPVLGNIGPILPDPGYLAEVRRVTSEHEVLLIFDEVITGYRLGIGGAQQYFGIKPDLTTLGKILGGGLPIGAFGGRKDIMSMIAPSGPVYQAGTFSGNPLSLTAGIATLNWIHDHPGMYSDLESNAATIEEACREKTGSFVRIGSMFKYYFRSQPPRNYREAKESDTTAFRQFWEKMLKAGIFLPPSQFETNFLSVAHTEQDIGAISQAYQTCI